MIKIGALTHINHEELDEELTPESAIELLSQVQAAISSQDPTEIDSAVQNCVMLQEHINTRNNRIEMLSEELHEANTKAQNLRDSNNKLFRSMATQSLKVEEANKILTDAEKLANFFE